MPQPFAIVSVAEMRDLEAAAVAAGTPERVLQERAGLGVADAVEAELAEKSGGGRHAPRVLVLAGSGNNGRDGVVAGRRLLARGCRVQIWHGARSPLSDGETRDLLSEGAAIRCFADSLPALTAAVEGSDVVIDALLGVGSRGALRPGLAAVARIVEAQRAGAGPLVVAADMPTGIDADSGAVDGEAITADITVTFGAVKAGLLRFPAAGHVGRLVPCSIGLPAGSADQHPVHVLDVDGVRPLVPPRPLDSHKYRLGRVLVVAGSDQFVGAACMASEAAARAGAGLVGLVSTEAVKRVLATRLPEATYPLTLPDLQDQSQDRPERSADAVAALLPEQAVLLIGPGIGRADQTERFLRWLLAANAAQAHPTPCVIDADALSLLAGWPDWWSQIGEGHVLTPHAGEMARLLPSDPGLARMEDEAPWETARRAAARWRQVVVLKGPFTTVAEPGGRAWVYPHANPALATAGTGDVLAGLTSGLAAQGRASSDAARLAVVVHALAGRRAAEGRGRRTLIAADLPPEIPELLAELAADGPWHSASSDAGRTPDDLRHGNENAARKPPGGF
jgi:NAD(P)H-hydrate epimerase